MTAQPLVERERESAELLRALALAAEHAGRVVMLEGPAGIGKTRLLAEGRAFAEERGFRVLAACGDGVERDFAFGVVRQLLERPLAEATREERRAMLDGAARFAEPLFGISPDAPAGPAIDLPFRRMHGLYWLCGNLAGERPLLISVDDLQWTDAPSLAFLDYLARRLDGTPILVMLSARSGDPGAEKELVRRLAAAPGVNVLRPGPLSTAAISVLAERAIGASVQDDFPAACRRLTGGVPLFVWELIRSLTSDGDPLTAASAARVADLGAEGVGRSVKLRLGRLGPAAERLSAAVSVLRDGTELRHVVALARLEFDDALAAVDALVGAGILESGRGVRFVHPIVRAAVYADLAPAERDRMHEAAARLMTADGRPSEEVAAHLVRLQPRGDRWIGETLLAAGRDAAARGAPDVAIALLQRALEEPPEEAAQADVLLALGSAEVRLGRPAAVEHLSSALERVTQPQELAGATLDLMTALAFSGRMNEGFRVLKRTIDVVAPEDRELALALEAALGGATKMGDYRAPLSPRWERYGPITGNTPAERILLGELAWERAFGGASADEVTSLAERAVADGAEAILLHSPASVQVFQIAYLMAICDSFTRTEAVLQEALGAGRAVGSLWLIASAETWLGDLALRRGRVAEAEAHGKAALDVESIIGWREAMAHTRSVLAQAGIERGALGQAEDVLDLAGAPAEAPPGITWTLALERRARLRLAQGRAEASLTDLYAVRNREVGRRADNPSSCPWRSEAALALHALDRDDEARALADEELGLARAFGAPRAIGVALRAAGVVTRGADGVERLREAVDILEGSGAVLEQARALTDLGAGLRRARHRVDARDPLRQGLQLARACGAIALATRAHEELLASGARPRRLTFQGPDSLTPSERRVAQMAADGMGNAEIAQALFVSRKTVETHLSHVYVKLGIASREKLTSALQPDALSHAAGNEVSTTEDPFAPGT